MNITDLPEKIQEAKRRTPLPELLALLGLEELARKSARCPWHHDKRNSFSIWQSQTGSWRWKCHGECAASGDEIEFLARALSVGRAEATKQFLTMAKFRIPLEIRQIRSERRLPKRISKHVRLPLDFRLGTPAEMRRVADLRHISVEAVQTAVQFGTLGFGTVHGQPCWIITDEQRLCAEARRIDGTLFPALGNLSERKAHTLAGSSKSWPVGIRTQGRDAREFRALMLVEGGPDYLAALHFSILAGGNWLPFAILGASVGLQLHQDALRILAGQRIRIYPHCDHHQAGIKAAACWRAQLNTVGAVVDTFDLGGICKLDGSLVKDLNDCTEVHPHDAHLLEGLLP